MSGELISIILPTYNMSAALKYAIESALMQTHQNFELLVIGDACTDDSEQVVNAFGDPRIRWFNLPNRVGHQWGPNNFGLQIARADIIGYHGHDDIWAPAHLERGLAAFKPHDADMVVNMSLLYGPPGSGVRGAMGLFPNEQYSPRFAFPPLSMLHTRALLERVGPWRPPHQSELGPEVDFIIRCHDAGAKIVPTRAPTVFKFNTTFRRGAYRIKDTSEQQRALSALRADPDGFIQSELVSLVQCALEDRFIRLEASGDPKVRAAVDTERVLRGWRSYKGLTQRDPAAMPALGSAPFRFFLEEEFTGFEWHATEQDPDRGPFRWSGPSTMSVIPLPVRVDRETTVSVHIIHAIDAEVLAGATITFNGRPLAGALAQTPAGTWLLEATLTPGPGDDDPHIAIVVPRTTRPFDALGSADRRWLGVAVNWVELCAVTAE